jgi:hypothetical protein
MAMGLGVVVEYGGYPVHLHRHTFEVTKVRGQGDRKCDEGLPPPIGGGTNCVATA